MNMDSPLSFKSSPSIRFWDEAGIELSAPREWLPCDVEFCELEYSGQHVRLHDKNISLMRTKKNGRMGVFANLPRCGPGKYRLELFDGEERLVTSFFEVLPGKFSSDAFGHMLDEVQFKLPHGIALSLEKMGGLVGVQAAPWNKSTWEHELILLQRAVYGVPPHRQGLIKILGALADNPHRKLKTESLWVKAYAARRVNATGLIQAAQHAGNLDESGHPIVVPDERSFSTADTYENRVLLFLLNMVSYRIKRLLKLKALETSSNTLFLRQMLKGLEAAKSSTGFLEEVHPLDNPPDHLSMVQMKVAPYIDSVILLRELTHVLSVQPRHPALEHPLQNVPLLYQYWGTLLIVDALVKFAEENHFRVEKHSLVKRDSRGWFVAAFPPGLEILHLVKTSSGEEIRCFAEKIFSKNEDKDGYYSLSYSKRPDICIELRKPGEAPKLIIFDPKYKLISENYSHTGQDEPVLADIDKMHTYRDAIRHLRSAHPVVFAGIIYPGKTKEFKGGLAALGCVPGITTETEIRKELNKAMREGSF